MTLSNHSYISPKAIIGKDVKIGPFCYVDDDVVIGNGCNLHPHATILEGTRLGNHCTVFSGAVLGGVPQDLKFEGEKSILEIEDHVTIREYVTVNRGTKVSGKTVIGHHSFIMAYVHIAHDCQLGHHTILSNAVNLAGHVEVGDYAILGGMVAVHQFSKIGAHVMIGGTVKVRKDVPPYIKADRDPISFMGVNSIGLNRRGFAAEKIDYIKDIYRHLFVKHTNLTTAIETADLILKSGPELTEIISFIQNSDRGILRGYNTDG